MNGHHLGGENRREHKGGSGKSLGNPQTGARGQRRDTSLRQKWLEAKGETRGAVGVKETKGMETFVEETVVVVNAAERAGGTRTDRDGLWAWPDFERSVMLSEEYQGDTGVMETQGTKNCMERIVNGA